MAALTRSNVRFGSSLCENAREQSVAAKSFLFDHLVCADEQGWRHGEAECFGRLEINNQLIYRRLLNRQIGRLGAFEDPIDVAACTKPQIR